MNQEFSEFFSNIFFNQIRYRKILIEFHLWDSGPNYAFPELHWRNHQVAPSAVVVVVNWHRRRRVDAKYSNIFGSNFSSTLKLFVVFRDEAGVLEGTGDGKTSNKFARHSDVKWNLHQGKFPRKTLSLFFRLSYGNNKKWKVFLFKYFFLLLPHFPLLCSDGFNNSNTDGFYSYKQVFFFPVISPEAPASH